MTAPHSWNYSEDGILAALKGAGDLATGVMHPLSRAGFAVMATELPQPTVLRRTIAFAEAVMLGQMAVEGLTAVRASSAGEIQEALAGGLVPIVVDPDRTTLTQIQPSGLVVVTL